MTDLLYNALQSMIIWFLLKGAVLLLVGFALVGLLRRHSASSRYLVWRLAFGGLLILPVGLFELPKLRFDIQPMESVATSEVPELVSVESVALGDDELNNARAALQVVPQAPPDEQAPATGPARPSDSSDPAIHWGKLIFIIWGVGCVALLAWQIVQSILIGRFARQSHELSEERWLTVLEQIATRFQVTSRIRLLQHASVRAPVTWGSFRPMIVVPAESDFWDKERWNAVLTHELCHIARFDYLTLQLIEIGCALQWCNPFVWVARRRAYLECEMSCDDEALQNGLSPAAYASQLVETARLMVSRPPVPVRVLGMSKRTELRHRIDSVLDPVRKRTGLNMGFAITLSILMFVTAVMMACSEVGAESRGFQTDGSISNVVLQKICDRENPTNDGAIINEAYAPSPDGKSLAFMDGSTGDLALLDLASNTTRRLTRRPDSTFSEFAFEAVFSPDGSRIAYAWFGAQPEGYGWSLRVIDASGANEQILLNAGAGYAFPKTWTADGREIIANYGNGSDQGAIVRISAGDGGLTHVIDIPDNAANMIVLSPDGERILFGVPVEEEEGNLDIVSARLDGSGLNTVVEHPGNDRILGFIPGTSQLMFLSNRYGSWDALGLLVSDGVAQGREHIIQQRIGRIYSLGFAQSGSFFFESGGRPGILEWIEVGSYTIDPSAQIVAGGNYMFPSWSPNGTKLAYVQFEQAPEGRHARTIHSLRFFDLAEKKEFTLMSGMRTDVYSIPRWSRDGGNILLLAYNPAHANEDGYSGELVRVDVESGDATTVLRFPASSVNWTITSRADWSADGRAVYYLDPVQGEIIERDLRTTRERIVLQDSLLIAERSGFFVPFAASPDGGAIALAVGNHAGAIRSIRLLEIATGALTEVAGFDGGDVREIVWQQDGRALYCAYYDEEEGEYGIMRHDIGSTEARKVWTADGAMRGITVHPDGRHIVVGTYTTGWSKEVWMMSNFMDRD